MKMFILVCLYFASKSVIRISKDYLAKLRLNNWEQKPFKTIEILITKNGFFKFVYGKNFKLVKSAITMNNFEYLVVNKKTGDTIIKHYKKGNNWCYTFNNNIIGGSKIIISGKLLIQYKERFNG